MKLEFAKRMAVLTLLNVLVVACGESSPSSSGNAGPVDGPVQDSASGPDDTNEIPCAARRVLQQTCQQCHSRPPKNDAPFPLVRRSDVLRRGRNGNTVRELMIVELESGAMPLAPVTMTAEARATLLSWARDGAPSVVPQTCSETQVSDEDWFDE